MDLSSRVRIPTQVITRVVGDETVILDLATGTYFGLDAVGAEIWSLMGRGGTLIEICGAMREKYDVSQEDIERDIIHLVETLRAQQLITVIS